MSTPGPRIARRFAEPVRRRLEVATAMAWEALAESHAEQALELVALLAGRSPFDEVVDRYIREMDLAPQLGAAVRTGVLSAIEEAERRAQWTGAGGLVGADGAGEAEGWRRFLPDQVVRGIQERHRRNEETEHWIQLALARAEEAIIHTHIEQAITFAALLEPHTTLGRAIDTYLRAVGVYGGRAQSIFQRTMARLAEVHLPRPTGTAALAALPPHPADRY